MIVHDSKNEKEEPRVDTAKKNRPPTKERVYTPFTMTYSKVFGKTKPQNLLKDTTPITRDLERHKVRGGWCKHHKDRGHKTME